ncbi:MAG: Wzz/FepE/Etk N-terminal domain-containing protein [Candidatus Neomarinimicrobiota bacterium]|nr:Wzz/FepE/Etk N-terminal domain-containing protein [Candidatus Neomarinimicrobiota bacterium]
MSINLSPHEKKILSLVDKYPSIIDDPLERKRIAELNGMSEKTLRNRLADLKRYGMIGEKNRIQNYNNIDEGFIGNFLLFWNNRKFILKNVIIVSLLSIIISLLLPKWYASKAVVLSSGAGQFNFLSSISPIPVADFGLSTINEDINNFIAILQSRTVKEYMVKKFNLVDRYKQRDIEFAMEAFEEKIELEVTEEGTLEITIFDKDPLMAKEMVNEVLFMLDQINQSIGMEAGKYNREFLENRININKKDLEKAELALKTFQEKTGIIDLVAQLSSTMQMSAQAYNSIFEAYTALYAKKIETETELAVAKTTLSNNNPTIMQLEKLLKEQTVQLEQLMIKLDEKLQYLLSNISPAQIDTVPNIEFSVSFNTLPSLGLENARLIRELELQSTIQEILIPQFEQAKLEETKNIPTLQIIDKPKVALNKSKPKRSLIVIASTVMSFLMSLIFLYTDHRTKGFRLAIKQSNS